MLAIGFRDWLLDPSTPALTDYHSGELAQDVMEGGFEWISVPEIGTMASAVGDGNNWSEHTALWHRGGGSEVASNRISSCAIITLPFRRQDKYGRWKAFEAAAHSSIRQRYERDGKEEFRCERQVEL